MSSIKIAAQFLIFALVLLYASLKFNSDNLFMMASALIALIFIGLPTVIFINALFDLAESKPINKK